ncbi:membrane-bound lytic murein transglycosylase B [Thiothrix eikelboomii]|uniref:Membrane-bound lytic murein transglycosylase B n=1 Tax=Thiothrix eikelboomii TaxID=92487 RepID=A0A1T4VXM1_9GAMM|nr:lytic murein transglycosylase B [Thiothrix eikelboomii]SKA69677.1 membrane-bound lytic murein transglycosylase B [Thiothrix eikelboomii]
MQASKGSAYLIGALGWVMVLSACTTATTIPEAGTSSHAKGVPAADPLVSSLPPRLPRPLVPIPARPKQPNPPYPRPPSLPSLPIPEPLQPQLPVLPVQGGHYLSYPALQTFIGRMQQVHGFDAGQLQSLFATVQRNEEIIAKASKPAEAKPWLQYRPIFITEDRIQSGMAFWQQYANSVEAAAQQYGIDPAYIVAIIGVETFYGRNTGNYSVLQALTTLAFDFPKRADFYQKELEQYLLLTREEQVQPLAWQGSYAGAMGLGQFISSSYRQYAQDFDQDGRRNLWDPEDAIGSVANYLARHGWQAGEDVAVPAYVSGQGYARLLSEKPVKPNLSLSALSIQWVAPVNNFRARQASLILLDGAAGSEFWLGGDNFYVITRYNHSNKYAMAVHQLAQAIRQQMGR